MGRNDMCFCGSGIKQKKCHANINEESIAARIIKFYNDLDKELDAFFVDKKRVCHKGCAACCGDYFPISETEFAIIMDFLMQNIGAEQVEKYIQKGLYVNKIFSEKYPEYYNKLQLNTTGCSKEEQWYIDYHNMPEKIGEECIFLNENEECSVYDVRPIICRTFGTCYESCMKEGIICSKIGTINEHKKDMMCIDAYREEMDSVKYYKGEGNKIIYRRSYPIFYWMNLYFGEGRPLSEYFKHPSVYAILHESSVQHYNTICRINGIK